MVSLNLVEIRKEDLVYVIKRLEVIESVIKGNADFFIADRDSFILGEIEDLKKILLKWKKMHDEYIEALSYRPR